MMNQVELNAHIGMLRAQRNAALDTLAQLSGQHEALKAEYEALQRKIIGEQIVEVPNGI